MTSPAEPTLAQSWRRVDSWLQRNAPGSHASLEASGEADVVTFEDHLGYPLPPACRAWFTTVRGTTLLTFAAQVLPAQILLTAQAAQSASNLRRGVWSAGEDESVQELLAATAEQPAGAMAWAWQPTFVPIGADGSGGCYFVDLRPGRLRGCVKQFNRDDGALYAPEWTSLSELLEDVADSLETGRACRGWRPTVDASGRLGWDFLIS